jgi:orotate phosphoribosyltransferase
MVTPAARQKLADIIYRRSFGRGDVTLASGKKSDYYFDMKPSMLDPQGAETIARMMHERVVAAGADMVGGLELGAVPITGSLVAVSVAAGKPLTGFIMRKKQKEHGAKKLIEGLARGETIKGRKVAILEDVTTTGGSAAQVIEECRAQGAEVALVLSIVDRDEGAAEFFTGQNVKFESLFKASEFRSRTD